MKIAVISTTIFPVPPVGYSGLEMIAWQQAEGLAKKGHKVLLVAPGGSQVPTNGELHGTTIGESEMNAYGGYWEKLLGADAVIDNSVAGDESLLVRINGKSKWITFELLFDWACSQGPAVVDGSGTVEISVHGLEVPSAESPLGSSWKPVAAVIRHLRKEPLQSVKVRGSNPIKLTPGHGLMVAKGISALEGLAVRDSLGALVATSTSIAAKQEETYFWPVDLRKCQDLRVSGKSVKDMLCRNEEVVKEAISARGIKRRSQDRRYWVIKKIGVQIKDAPELPEQFSISGHHGSSVSWPIPLTDSLLEYLGLWVGDGSYDSNSIHIAGGIETEHVAADVASQFGTATKLSSHRPDVTYMVHSVLLKGLMQASGFVGKSHTKLVPDWVFDLSSRQIGHFLKGYFSSDGHISKFGGERQSKLCCNTVNKRLACQVQVLLQLCGIRSNLYDCKHFGGFLKRVGRIWEVQVPIDQLPRFGEVVGFVQDDKVDRLEEHPNVGLSRRGDFPFELLRERKVRSDSQGKYGKVLSLSKIEARKGASIAESLMESGIVWRKVIGVSSLPEVGGHDYVYDLSVPGTENFLVGTTFCHNSWQKWAYILKAEGKLKAPVLGVMHTTAETMYGKAPPVDKPCLVAISQDQAGAIMGQLGVKSRVAYNGADPEFYKPAEDPRTERYLFLGRMSKLKGPHIAALAAKECRVSLDLVGDDKLVEDPDYVRRVKALAHSNQIVYHGEKPRSECPAYFSSAKALLHCNAVFREPFGLAPVEAMMCGAPVIAWNHGAMRETVKNGETGFLVSTYEELVKLIDSNAVKDIDSAACRKWAMRFSVENMVNRYEELCKEAIEKGW